MAALPEVQITFGASRLSAKAFIQVKDTRYAHCEWYLISLRLRAGQKIDIHIAQGKINYLFSVLKSVRVRCVFALPEVAKGQSLDACHACMHWMILREPSALGLTLQQGWTGIHPHQRISKMGCVN